MTGLKLLCAAYTLGVNDTYIFRHLADYLRVFNVVELYHRTVMFNHPPLVASYLTLLDALTGRSIQQFAFFIRLPGILADLVVALVLISQRRREPIASCPTWALALFIASPVSFLVSGFHGNFDSAVVCFIFLAAWMCVRGQPAASALFLALSLQIKVPAMIVMPVFLIYWYRQKHLRTFMLCLSLVCAAGWADPLIHDPRIFLHNVFSYNSYWGGWGITYWLVHTLAQPLLMTGLSNLTLPEKIITQSLKAIVVGGVTWLAWTRRPFTKEKIFPTLAIAWSLFFCFTPGAGMQYLVWLAPFVLLYHPRWYLGLTICCSLSCYFFYRIVCNSWLLYYGEAKPEDYLLWSSWMIWAWLSCSFGLYLFWLENQPKTVSSI